MCTFVPISNFCQNEVKKKAGGQSQDPLLLVFVTCGDKCSLFLAGAGVVACCSYLQLPPKCQAREQGSIVLFSTLCQDVVINFQNNQNNDGGAAITITITSQRCLHEGRCNSSVCSRESPYQDDKGDVQ